MSVVSWLLMVLVALSDSDPDQVLVSHQPGSPRQCFAEFGEKLPLINVLPGRGWDNLRNVELSSVLAYNYSKCRTTYDGKYLLPDYMSAIPVLQSKVDTYTEVFVHFSNYTFLTASSINSDFTVFSFISGRYSTEYKTFKQKMVNQKSVVSRIQLRHLRYMIRSSPSAPLNTVFEHRLLQIAASIQSNLTGMATYLSQLLVRDYGTHYTHTTHVGAVLAKTDYLSRDVINKLNIDGTSIGTGVSVGVQGDDSSLFNISAGAQADFFSDIKIAFNVTYKRETTQLENYQRFIKSTSIETHGGPLFTTNMTVAEWEAGVESSMVAIDREGDPIHFLINPDTLPEIPPLIVNMVAQYVKQAADKYYSINTHRGCTDFSSSNFDYFANIDDSTCKDISQNFTFGGVYQTCRVTQGDNLCERLEQKNPLTQDYSCPSGYTAIRLMTGEESYRTNKPNCYTTYRSCGFLGWSRCTSGQACQTRTVISKAEFKTFWCARNSSEAQNLYYFGGIYTASTPNPLTSTHGCPNHFQSLKFTSKGRVCVSGDNELGRPQSLPFGGFHSCDAGNPLAKTDQDASPVSCPEGFSQHLALVDDDCEIKYCLRAGALSNFLQTPILLPPYMDLPDSFINQTNNLYILDVKGNLWENTGNGAEWTVISPESEDYVAAITQLNNSVDFDLFTSQETVEGSNPSEQPINTGLAGAAFGIVVTLTVLLILVFTVVCGMKWTRRRKQIIREQQASEVHENRETVNF